MSRDRLIRRLDDGVSRKLTLLSAPAGYGKTTLLSEWTAQAAQPVAWLSLDGEDNDPARFWSYLVAALQQDEPDLSRDIPEVLRSLQGPPTPALLAALINQVDSVAGDSEASGGLVLVLDDYHVVTTRSIHEGLSFLLDHMPASLHLVVASRSDPPLPLHLLRARRQLAELRAADLRFTTAEAAVFLNEVMGLQLSADHVAALERRTEGWITGLQLAALSMEGRDDVSGFVRALTGSHRYVLDYLAEEVLHRQPEPVQTFLLRTSILDRLTGPLCDAVSGQEDGFETLEALEQADWTPPGTVSTIGAIYSHVITYVDFILQEVCIGQSDAVLAEPPPEEIRMQKVQVELSTLHAYADEVETAAHDWLSSLTPKDLEREMETSIGQLNLGQLLEVYIIWHINVHCGEISALKGCQGLKGYPW